MLFDVLAWLVLAGLVVLVGLFYAWARLTSRFLTYLEKRFPREFEWLGKPHLLSNNTPAHAFRFIRYIHSSRPTRLNDPYIERTRRTLVNMFYAYLGIFAYIMAYMFVSAFF